MSCKERYLKALSLMFVNAGLFVNEPDRSQSETLGIASAVLESRNTYNSRRCYRVIPVSIMKSTGILLTIISASTGLGALADIAVRELLPEARHLKLILLYFHSSLNLGLTQPG